MHSPFSFLRKWKDQSHRWTSYFQNEVIASTTWNNGKHALLLLPPPPPRGPLWRFRLCSHVSAGEYLAWAAKAGCQKLVYTIPFMRIAWFFLKKPKFSSFYARAIFILGAECPGPQRKGACWLTTVFFSAEFKGYPGNTRDKSYPLPPGAFYTIMQAVFCPHFLKKSFQAFLPLLTESQPDGAFSDVHRIRET